MPLSGLVSFMLDPSEPKTTGGKHESLAKRREHAAAFFKFNCGHRDFADLFPEFTDASKVTTNGGKYNTTNDKVQHNKCRGDFVSVNAKRGQDRENVTTISDTFPILLRHFLCLLM